ncbi:MAG: hypothetical protein HOV80_14215 [Polyangiaceae bacterium]|nr:hypothetical protein [Polyangiaceae bacterium]
MPLRRITLALGSIAVGIAVQASCTEEVLSPSPRPAAEARFELSGDLPRLLDVPFPSDIYLDDDGTIIDSLPGLEDVIPNQSETLAVALGRLNGFGLISGAMFRVDSTREKDESGAPAPALVDEASLPASASDCLVPTSSVLIVELETGALVPCRAAYQDDRPNGSISRPVLAVLPARGVILAEGRRYAAVLTRNLIAGGEAIAPSDTFRRIRGGARDTEMEAFYADAIDEIVRGVTGLAREDIVAVAPFTTQRVTKELTDLRALVDEFPPPQILWDEASVAPMFPAFFTRDPFPGATATLDEWLGTPDDLPDGRDDPAVDQPNGHAHDAIAAIATGVFEAPNFLLYRDGYTNPEHKTFARGQSGEIVQNAAAPTAKIWVTIAIPDRPMPPEGYPVVVVQHGLQGERSFLLSLANTFAHEGWVSVAIEADTFGARSATPSFHTDIKSRFAWSATSGYAGPDGLVDLNANALHLFGEMINFGATSAQFRQSAVDFGTLANVLANPEIDLGPLAALQPGLKLDAERLVYVADSFGSVLGTLVAAIDPRYRAMVLNVGGGGILTELASNGPLLAGFIGTLGGLTFGLTRDRLNWKHPLVNLVQPVLDAADPLSYADALVRNPVTVDSIGGPKSIVYIEVLWDELIANSGTEALAVAAGIPFAGPSTGPMSELSLEEVAPQGGVVRGAPSPDHTVVVVQASPASHGVNLYAREGFRLYAAPFVVTEGTGFDALPESITINQPYLGLQDMVVQFFAGSFAGEVPAVGGFPVPVRDFDQDGVPDASDPAPLDPAN